MIIVEPGFTGITYPLSHPRVGAFAVSGTVAASSEAAGFSAVFAANLKTNQWWRPITIGPVSPAVWSATFASSAISYFGIAAHDMASKGVSFNVSRYNGASYDFVLAHTPVDDGPIFALMPRRSIAGLYFQFFGASPPTIGVISMGDVIEFPQRAQYTGSTSFELADQDEYRDTVSEGGQVLDRFRIRRSIPAKMDVMHMSENWTDANLTPLRSYAKDYPFFMADRPLARPKSVVFGQTKGPIQPQRAIANAAVAMNVSIEVMGHDGA